MGRSVSTPTGNLVSVCYRDVTEIEDELDWSDFVDDIRFITMSLAPSLYEQDGWAGREDQILLQNGHVEIGVSEYCGLAAIWMRVRGDIDHEEIAEAWAAKFAPKFEEAWAEFRRVGVFSNGEAIYERV